MTSTLGGIVFPSGLPCAVSYFSPAQMDARYGMQESDLPRHVALQINRFEAWSTAPINTTRSETWSRSVQSTTIGTSRQVIRAYMGYCSALLKVPDSQLSLALMAHPDKLAMFLAFLQARDVGKEHVLKQISTARKVADFLKAGTSDDSGAAKHVAKLDRWLRTLATQISASMPVQQSAALPANHDARRWADNTAVTALDAIAHDRQQFGRMTKKTALIVEEACILGLVVGTAFPPVRLDLIKTMPHPRYAARGCRDLDCLYKHCKGNRLVLSGIGAAPLCWSEGGEEDGDRSEGGEEDGDQHGPRASPEEELEGQQPGPGRSGGQDSDSERPGPSARSPEDTAGALAAAAVSVSVYVVHGKNDRRDCAQNYQIDFEVPKSDLSTLLVEHTREGYPLLTKDQPSLADGRLFVTSIGQSFSNATFVQFWTRVFRNTGAKFFNLTYFPPSKARNMFVEAYTDSNGGAPPEFWDGAAAVMGNTPRQWTASYNASKRQRDATKAVGCYGEFLQRQR